jgi:hypothetical protein
MRLNVTNRAIFEAASKKLTKDGFLVNFNVPIARDGIIEYAGRELNRPEMEKVRAYRPAETFTPEVIESAKMLPVTIDHPHENVVSPTNAKRTVIGATGSEVSFAKGELIEKMVTIYDKDAIRDIEEFGKKEVSIGLLATHDFTPGKTPDGLEYDAIENVVSINHLSVVSAGKAGPRYRLNSKQEENKMSELVKKTVNGLELEMTKASAALLNAKKEETEKSVLNTVLEGISKTVEEHSKVLKHVSETVNAIKNSVSEEKAAKEENKEETKKAAKGSDENKEDEKSEEKDCVNAIIKDSHEETVGAIYSEALKTVDPVFIPGGFR